MSGVRTKHPDYIHEQALRSKCRDAIAGTEAIHKAGKAYLFRLSGQSDAEYEAYKARADFFNASGRTAQGLVGMMFRKAPAVVAPTAMDEMLKNIDQAGTDLDTFTQNCSAECVAVKKVGILTSYPELEDAENKTKADTIALGLRPQLAMYRAESVINWSHGVTANQKALTSVVLEENKEVPGDTEFEIKSKKQWRVLDLSGGYFRQRIFEVNDKEEDVLISEVYPQLGGNKMSFIPFVILDVADTPPLLDLVNTNISHYRSTADLEHGAHYTGLPIFTVSGYQKQDGEEIHLGGEALVFPDPNADPKWLEFKGQGLGALEKRIEHKELQMAVLGARMLESQKTGVEAAETAAIHRSGEQSVLAAMAQVISQGVTKALKTFAEWAGIASDDISVEINRDFMPMPLDSQRLTALVMAWQAGAISDNSLYYNLKAGEMYPEEWSEEDEDAARNTGSIPAPGVTSDDRE